MPQHLLHNIVQALTLANFKALILILFTLLDGGCVGTAFVDIDQAGFPQSDNLAQKA